MGDAWLTLTASGGGWALFGSTCYFIITGKLITSREADAMQRRIDSLEQQVKDLTEQNTLLMREGLPATNAVLDALRALVADR